MFSTSQHQERRVDRLAVHVDFRLERRLCPGPRRGEPQYPARARPRDCFRADRLRSWAVSAAAVSANAPTPKPSKNHSRFAVELDRAGIERDDGPLVDAVRQVVFAGVENRRQIVGRAQRKDGNRHRATHELTRSTSDASVPARRDDEIELPDLRIVQTMLLQVDPVDVVACPLQASDELVGQLRARVRRQGSEIDRRIRTSRRVPGPGFIRPADARLGVALLRRTDRVVTMAPYTQPSDDRTNELDLGSLDR